MVGPALHGHAAPVPLNRMERRRLAVGMKKPAPGCACCRPAAIDEDPDQLAGAGSDKL